MTKEAKQGKQRKQIIQKYMAILFLVILIGTVLLNMVKQDRLFSENENRLLASKPDFTVSKFMSGRYTKQYESYQADQFVGRDFWVQIKTWTDKLYGKREENGVFQGRDHYLMEDIIPATAPTVNENLNAMKRFQQTYKETKMHMVLVPDAATIMKEKLPIFAVTSNQKVQINQVKKKLGNEFIWNDAVKPLEENKEKGMYYHTDHHWTTKGAYVVFQSMTKSLEIDQKQMIEMKSYPISNSFNGTLSAASGYERNYQEPIDIYLPKDNETEVLVHYVEEQKKTASMYQLKKLKVKDQYGMFLDGNHPLVSLKTTSSSSDRMLVIKDSYANCFIPFLTPYYREIVVADPRYYYGDIHTLMEEHHFDRVLFLYNANTFFKDNNLAGMLSNE